MLSSALFTWPAGHVVTALELNEAVAALNGSADVAVINLANPTPNPAAISGTVLSQSGNLNGAYQWVMTETVGLVDGNGNLHPGGQTGMGTPSNLVNPSNNPVALTVPAPSARSVSRTIWRTQAGGTTFYFLVTLTNPQVSTWIDDVADADLGTETAPTVNNTGTVLSLPVFDSVPTFSVEAGTLIAVTNADNATTLYRSDGSGWLALPDLAVANTWTGAQTFESATLSGVTTNSGTINGGVIASSTLSGTTTNSGTISGGTISGATLSGTTTNSGTISGGTVNPASGTVAGNWSAGPVVLWGGGVPSTPPLNVTALGWDFDPGTNSPGTSGFFNNYGTGNAGGFKWWVAAENATSWTNTASLDPSGNFSTVGSLTVGGTINGATLSGTTTNSGTISGGTLTPATVTASTTVYVANSASGTTPGTTAGTYLGIGDTPNLFIKAFNFYAALNNTNFVMIASSGSAIFFDGSLSSTASNYGGWIAIQSVGANALQLAPAGSVTTAHNTLDNGSGDMTVSGALTSVGGQATTGSFGVATVVATTSATVTTTGSVTILSYTTGTSVGSYILYSSANIDNGTSGNDVGFSVTEDAYTVALSGNSNAADANVTFTGSVSIPNGRYWNFPVFINVGPGVTITISYNDPTNTPNDIIWATIVRVT